MKTIDIDRLHHILTVRIGVVAIFLSMAAGSNAQIWIREVPGQGIGVWGGSIEAYPLSNRFARPRYHNNFYADYGARRLEGRVLALPWGFSPPSSPAALDRYTIATFQHARSGPGVVVTPSRPPYYPRESHIKSYRHQGYIRRR